MKNRLPIVWLFLAAAASTQTPASMPINVNSVYAKVWANGSLFGFGNERGFKIPASDDNDSVKISTFRRVVPWVGGYDDFGNLKLACIKPTGTLSDFAPGLIDVDGYDQIWKVTKAEITAHIADFNDNGVIDNLIPAIMNWPETGLLTAISYSPPAIPTDMAPYYDNNFNGVYDPMEGDFPTPNIGNWYDAPGIPDEILFFAFHDIYEEHEASRGKHMGLQFLCTVWAYSCPEEPALDNSIFVSMEYWNRSTEPLDSLHFGLMMSYEIGSGNDDYIGCIPDDKIFYGYNGDSIDQNGFGTETPVVAMFPIGREPPIPISNPFISELPYYFMRVGNIPGTSPASIGYPDSPQGYYNYLTGHWLDGTPLRAGGNGYHPLDTSSAVNWIYPGDPSDTAGWSEPTAGSIPDLRRALVSYASPRMNPGARQRRSFCFNWARRTNTPDPLKAAIEQIQTNKSIVDNLNAWDLHPPISTPSCLYFSNVSTAAPLPGVLKIWPNPSTGDLHISAPDETLQSITVTDLLGKVVYERRMDAVSELSLDLSLPSGVYILVATTKRNTHLMQKLVISR